MELRMAVKLRVQNPNDAALDYDGISLALDVAGSTFASGVSAGRGSVPRFGETVVTVPVSVSALNVLRQVVNMTRQGRPSRIDYVMRGRMSSAAFGGMRFQSKGEIDLPEGMTGPQ
jgi:LEA14-like dessication related protein